MPNIYDNMTDTELTEIRNAVEKELAARKMIKFKVLKDNFREAFEALRKVSDIYFVDDCDGEWIIENFDYFNIDIIRG